MYGNSCHSNSCGSFIMGTAAGMLAGVAVGTMMATPSRQLKRPAHKAARRVNEALAHLAAAMAM